MNLGKVDSPGTVVQPCLGAVLQRGGRSLHWISDWSARGAARPAFDVQDAGGWPARRRDDAHWRGQGVLGTVRRPCAVDRPVDCRPPTIRPMSTSHSGRCGAAGCGRVRHVCLRRGATEAAHLRRVADFVRDAERLGMPVIVHTYPRRFHGAGVEISFAPEDIAWAVRCGVECGVDVIKVPYCGDQAAYAQIVRRVPVAGRGGRRAEGDDAQARCSMAAEVVASGAKGMTVGRNIWGFPQVGRPWPRSSR